MFFYENRILFFPIPPHLFHSIPENFMRWAQVLALSMGDGKDEEEIRKSNNNIFHVQTFNAFFSHRYCAARAAISVTIN